MRDEGVEMGMMKGVVQGFSARLMMIEEMMIEEKLEGESEILFWKPGKGAARMMNWCWYKILQMNFKMSSDWERPLFMMSMAVWLSVCSRIIFWSTHVLVEWQQ